MNFLKVPASASLASSILKEVRQKDGHDHFFIADSELEYM